MGLDTSYDCWHGAYSAFHRWRTRIAEVSGYASKWPDGLEIDDAEDGAAVADGTWKKLPNDPILVLLCHSDCDGQIAPEHAGPLADRLEGLLPNLHGDGGGYLGDYKAATERFIKGLRQAAADGEPIDFR